ncbi:hypothetical protein [Methanooceanicella nereidis]|nr:hypothetical protein [Methanocella sp. CWC-04]
MKGYDKFKLLIIAAVFLGILGYNNISSWLMEHVIITGEVKLSLFILSAIGFVASWPEPLNLIGIIGIIMGVPIICNVIAKAIASLWYEWTY